MPGDYREDARGRCGRRAPLAAGLPPGGPGLLLGYGGIGSGATRWLRGRWRGHYAFADGADAPDGSLPQPGLGLRRYLGDALGQALPAPAVGTGGRRVRHRIGDSSRHPNLQAPGAVLGGRWRYCVGCWRDMACLWRAKSCLDGGGAIGFIEACDGSCGTRIDGLGVGCERDVGLWDSRLIRLR